MRWEQRFALAVLASIACGAAIATADPKLQVGGSEEAPPSGGAASRAKYADHVMIDWRFPFVELEARVVLRSGPLELIACSPGTREHESILQVPARPLHVFEALGLIGLCPGAPVRYEPTGDKWIAATGDPLLLRVWADYPFGETSVPVEALLMRLPDRTRNVSQVRWVFAGSDRTTEGAFGADLEGTIACVVDFGAALIAVGESHSSDDALLWLGADPTWIPKEGTRCRLLISDARIPRLTIQITPQGQLRMADKDHTPAEIFAAWQSPLPASASTPAPGKSSKPETGATPGKQAESGPPVQDLKPNTTIASVRTRPLVELSPTGPAGVELLRKGLAELIAAGIPSTALLVDPRPLEAPKP